MKDALWSHSGAVSEDGPVQSEQTRDLGGYISDERLESAEAPVGSVDGTFPKQRFTCPAAISTFQVPPPPSDFDIRSIISNQGGSYQAAASLSHWFRWTHQPLLDYGGATNNTDVTDDGNSLDPDGAFAWTQAANPDGFLGLDDHVHSGANTAPPTMGDQRTSYPVATSSNSGGMWGQNRGAGWDGDGITYAFWIYSEDHAAGPKCFHHHGFLTQSLITLGQAWFSIGDVHGANYGRLCFRKNSDPGADPGMDIVGTTVLNEDQWYHVIYRFNDLTQTASIWLNGVRETLTTDTWPAAFVMYDNPAQDYTMGSADTVGNIWQFEGRLHSMAIWTIALPDDACLAISQFGDGPEFTQPPVNAFAGAWLTVESGPNEGSYSEISEWDDGTGDVTLVDPLPNDIAVSDVVRFWAPNGIFASYNADQSLRRPRKTRFFIGKNDAVVKTDTFWYVENVRPGPLQMSFALHNIVGANWELPPRGEEDYFLPAGPITSGNAITHGFTGGPSVASWTELYSRASTRDAGEFQTPQINEDWLANHYMRALVKLEFFPGEPIPLPYRCVFALRGESAAGDITTVMIVVDIAGPDIVLDLGPDRDLRLHGGCRVEARVRTQSTGQAVPGKTIQIRKESGPGTLHPQTHQEPTAWDNSTPSGFSLSQPEGSFVYAVYVSPTDEGEVGNPVDFVVEIN